MPINYDTQILVIAYLLVTVHLQTLHHMIPPAGNKVSCEIVNFPSNTSAYRQAIMIRNQCLYYVVN